MNIPDFELPYITADQEGIGGTIKSAPSHFVVEEIPLYEPSGQGNHIYFRTVREGMTTRDVVKGLAGLFGLKEMDVGCAGQKDKQARAVQTFSLNLPNLDPDEAAGRIAAEMPVEVLSAGRHANKLRTGHLIGNRFTVVLTGVGPNSIDPARKIAAALLARGLPNFYGEQRFGVEGDNARRGFDALYGRGPKQPWLRRFLLSAFQSHLFNAYLAERIGRDWFDKLLTGDVAKKTDTGGLFLVEDEAAERSRFETRAITYTGPIYGRKMKRAEDRPGELENEILDRFDVTTDLLKNAKLEGSRRPARIFIPNVAVSPHEEGLTFDFSLPKGAYATTVMREFMKTPPAAGGSGDPL